MKRWNKQKEIEERRKYMNELEQVISDGSIEFEKDLHNTINFETFDFDIIQSNINPLADSAINEIWPLLRLLWKAKGAYTVDINITPEHSYAEFGDRLGCNFTANYKFSIDSLGAWSADFKFDFKQDKNAWTYQDYSRETSMSARRARQLAHPGTNGDVLTTSEMRHVHLKQTESLQELDLSFEYNYVGNGKF
jgi:hypothetical protein